MDTIQAVPNAVASTVGAVLDELAVRFGATGAGLWESLVRYEAVQAVVTIWAFGILGAVGLVLLVVGGYIGITTKNYEREQLFGGVAVVGCVILFTVFIMGTVILPDAFTTMQVPEGAVLRDLLRRF